MTRQIRPATNVNTLNDRINKAAGDIGSGLRLRSAVATTVVAQMLPPGAVKGGAAMKLRLGHEHTRFTRDLDLARRDPLDQFVADLQSRLDSGWGVSPADWSSGRRPGQPAYRSLTSCSRMR
jgi:hypothetical protein